MAGGVSGETVSLPLPRPRAGVLGSFLGWGTPQLQPDSGEKLASALLMPQWIYHNYP